MGADTEGQWESVPAGFKIPVAPTILHDPYDATRTITDTRGLFVVHATLLRTGKVLCFCGHVEAMDYAPIVYLYNPRVPASTPLKQVPMPADTDLFCCHCVQLYDGRILVVGGSQQDVVKKGQALEYHGSEGAATIAVFDPATETFDPLTLKLAQGRWYPTVVLRADGQAIVLSGRRDTSAQTSANPFAIADAVELISAKADRIRTLAGAAPLLPIYPGAHLAPDGNIYTTHTTWGQEVNEPPSQRLTASSTSASWTPLNAPAPQPRQALREEGMSVPLPVTIPRASSRGRYLIVGGGQAMGRSRTSPNPTGTMARLGGVGRAVFTGQLPGISLTKSEILDTTASPPTWNDAPGKPLTHPRVNCHCVLLPDATIAVMGGHDAFKWQAGANVAGNSAPTTTPTLHVELYTPGSGYEVGAPMTFPRMYHSVALLLPDGRVLIAGGADPNEQEPWLNYPAGWAGRRYDERTDPGPGPAAPAGPRLNGRTGVHPILNRKDYQIYKPPYLCKGLPQPTIASVTPGIQVLYGATFTVTTPQAASIRHVAIMRPGAVTHHTDTEQRYVELDFAPPAGDDIKVTMVNGTEANVVTPGYYMLWIIDDKGIPCANATFIQVAYPPPWPAPTNDAIQRWPCIIATVSMGSASAADVVFLRAARDELAASGEAGRRFIGMVHRAYYSFSPQTARWLVHHPRWRAATRDIIVRPGASCIRAARRCSEQLPWPAARPPALIALLVAEGLLALAAAPIVAVAMYAHVALRAEHG